MGPTTAPAIQALLPDVSEELAGEAVVDEALVVEAVTDVGVADEVDVRVVIVEDAVVGISG
jgi:hypothetical protein